MRQQLPDGIGISVTASYLTDSTFMRLLSDLCKIFDIVWGLLASTYLEPSWAFEQVHRAGSVVTFY